MNGIIDWVFKQSWYLFFTHDNSPPHFGLVACTLRLLVWIILGLFWRLLDYETPGPRQARELLLLSTSSPQKHYSAVRAYWTHLGAHVRRFIDRIWNNRCISGRLKIFRPIIGRLRSRQPRRLKRCRPRRFRRCRPRRFRRCRPRRFRRCRPRRSWRHRCFFFRLRTYWRLFFRFRHHSRFIGSSTINTVRLMISDFCMMIYQFPMFVHNSFNDGIWLFGPAACELYACLGMI